MDWEFARDGQKVQLTLDGALAVYDHDAYLVAGLMSFGHIGDLPAKPSPLGEGARLRRLGERADTARSNLPDALDLSTRCGHTRST
jgi:hypothetical protein